MIITIYITLCRDQKTGFLSTGASIDLHSIVLQRWAEASIARVLQAGNIAGNAVVKGIDRFSLSVESHWLSKQ